MLWPKKIHTRNLMTKKKIPAARKFPSPPPMIFLMVRPLLLSINTIKEIMVIISIKKKPF